MEIDCWNGSKANNEPVVTHGHTFCTIEKFDAVAEAVADCMFAASDLPVMLSLEMHCSPRQQRRLTEMMVHHIGDALLKYDVLAGTGHATSLSPVDLKQRVLAKGKVKKAEKSRSSSSRKPRRFTVKACLEHGASNLQIVEKSSSVLGSSSFKNTNDSEQFTDGTTSSPKAHYQGSGIQSNVDEMSATSQEGNALQDVESSIPQDLYVEKEIDDDDTVPQADDVFRRNSEVGDLADLANLVQVEELVEARSKLKKRRKSLSGDSDDFYVTVLTLRSQPLSSFLSDSPSAWVLPITSIGEYRMLQLLGLRKADRDEIAGLQLEAASASFDRHDETSHDSQLRSSRAIVRLACSPPAEVGSLQRRTARKLLRPYPHGLRFSGNNMSPLPCWLAGAQYCALNMSNIDVPLHLHFALFNRSRGFVLKPQELRDAADGADDEVPWPPLRGKLHRTSIEILSLHNIPKRGERRPRYDGRHSESHKHVPELSGKAAPPNDRERSSPALRLTLHPIAGVCVISKKLPVQQGADTEMQIASSAKSNGLNPAFDGTAHCLAAEPHATFLRIGITDGRLEVAYESAVLGRLRAGYRVFQLRSSLGTRIELAYLFVRISFGEERSLGMSRQTQIAVRQVGELRDENAVLKQQMERLTQSSRETSGTESDHRTKRSCSIDHDAGTDPRRHLLRSETAKL